MRRVGVFRETLWGLRIERVVCDGKEIQPRPFSVVLGDYPYYTFSPPANIIIYSLGLTRISVARWFNPGLDEYELVEYELPKGYRSITIDFRVRLADGTVGPLMQAKSVDVDEFGIPPSSDEKPANRRIQ